MPGFTLKYQKALLNSRPLMSALTTGCIVQSSALMHRSHRCCRSLYLSFSPTYLQFFVGCQDAARGAEQPQRRDTSGKVLVLRCVQCSHGQRYIAPHQPGRVSHQLRKLFHHQLTSRLPQQLDLHLDAFGNRLICVSGHTTARGDHQPANCQQELPLPIPRVRFDRETLQASSDLAERRRRFHVHHRRPFYSNEVE